MTRLFVGTHDGLLLVDGSDDEWTVRRRLQDARPTAVARATTDPDRVLCGTADRGLFRSLDGGQSFARAGADDIAHDRITAVAADPSSSTSWWVGTEPSRVYRSTDDGVSWSPRPGLTELPSADQWSFPPRPDTHHVRWIEPDPARPDHLYVGIEAGALVQTRDGGANWEDRRPGTRVDNHSMATHRDAQGHVWAAAGDGFAMSTDGGINWIQPEDGLDHRYCWSVALDRGDPETVVLSAASGPGAAHSNPGESYLYRRQGTDPWERLDDRGIPTGRGVLRAVLASGDRSGRLYAATNRGCFRTDDAGEHWFQLPIEWPTELASRPIQSLAVAADGAE